MSWTRETALKSRFSLESFTQRPQRLVLIFPGELLFLSDEQKWTCMLSTGVLINLFHYVFIKLSMLPGEYSNTII